MLQGAVPVRATDKLAEEPAHIVALPLITAVGNGSTVTVTFPEIVFVPSLTTTVYRVVTDGLTAGFASKEVNPAGSEFQL